MSYLQGADRSEVQLLPPCPDDYVAAHAPARFINAYAEGLEFASLGFAHARPGDTARPPYHPADLLKLFLYGFLHRIRSSRWLEAEAARNPEAVRLPRGVRPDFETLADSRRDNRAAFRPPTTSGRALAGPAGVFTQSVKRAMSFRVRLQTVQKMRHEIIPEQKQTLARTWLAGIAG